MSSRIWGKYKGKDCKIPYILKMLKCVLNKWKYNNTDEKCRYLNYDLGIF